MNTDPHNQTKWWILSVTSLGTLLSALNFSTLIIALPDLIKGLHATVLQAMWVMLSYMVAQTIAVLIAGSLADRFGRKRLFLWGMILFTVVSFASGFAPNSTWLILMRILQGIGGAMVMANSTAIVADVFPSKQLGQALGVNIMVAAVGQIIGPVLGGWLATAYGWEWTFWFNVPFGLVAIIWGIRIMGFTDVKVEAKNKRFDSWGVVTYTLSISGLLLALTWGPLQSWSSPVVWISFAAFIVAFPIFLIIEKKHSAPLLHIPLFFNRIFTLGVVSATLNAIARMSVMFMLIFYFQGALSFDALQAGILTIPLAVGMFIFSPLSGWMGDRYGETLPATLGLFVTLLGLVGLSLDTSLTTPYWQMALWMSLVGIGAGLFNSPNSSSVMNSAGIKFRGEASGIRSLTTNMGMMLSIAFTMPLITHSMPREAMLAIFSGTKVGLDGATSSLQSFVQGLHTVFWTMSALLVLATILSFMRAGNRPGIELKNQS
jgi:EmrB/QacA subfamily drug resistance transporter